MQNPIDKQQRERLNGARRRLKDAWELCQRCKAAGIDVADREQLIFELSNQLDALHQAFVGELNPSDVVVTRPTALEEQAGSPAEVRGKGKRK